MKINQKRLARLKKHLLKAQELTGGKLRENYLASYLQCPLLIFSPIQDNLGNTIVRSSNYGAIIYRNPHTLYEHEYANIFTRKDSDWWAMLDYRKCKLYNDAINDWIANGCKEVK